MSDESNAMLEANELDQLLDTWTRRHLPFLQEVEQPAIVGIRTRGVPLGRRIQQQFEEETGNQIEFGILDITLYRDDLDVAGARPKIEGTEILFELEGRSVLLVDDVIFTGRTIRAALDELFDFGRPSEVRLSVLVDRGCRELPIQPNFTGKQMDLPPDKRVRLRLRNQDSEHGIFVEPHG